MFAGTQWSKGKTDVTVSIFKLAHKLQPVPSNCMYFYCSVYLCPSLSLCSLLCICLNMVLLSIQRCKLLYYIRVYICVILFLLYCIITTTVFPSSRQDKKIKFVPKKALYQVLYFCFNIFYKRPLLNSLNSLSFFRR